MLAAGLIGLSLSFRIGEDRPMNRILALTFVLALGAAYIPTPAHAGGSRGDPCPPNCPVGVFHSAHGSPLRSLTTTISLSLIAHAFGLSHIASRSRGPRSHQLPQPSLRPHGRQSLRLVYCRRLRRSSGGRRTTLADISRRAVCKLCGAREPLVAVECSTPSVKMGLGSPSASLAAKRMVDRLS